MSFSFEIWCSCLSIYLGCLPFWFVVACCFVCVSLLVACVSGWQIAFCSFGCPCLSLFVAALQESTTKLYVFWLPFKSQLCVGIWWVSPFLFLPPSFALVRRFPLEESPAHIGGAPLFWAMVLEALLVSVLKYTPDIPTPFLWHDKHGVCVMSTEDPPSTWLSHVCYTLV